MFFLFSILSAKPVAISPRRFVLFLLVLSKLDVGKKNIHNNGKVHKLNNINSKEQISKAISNRKRKKNKTFITFY
jgi:hypothetical protein